MIYGPLVFRWFCKKIVIGISSLLVLFWVFIIFLVILATNQFWNSLYDKWNFFLYYYWFPHILFIFGRTILFKVSICKVLFQMHLVNLTLKVRVRFILRVWTVYKFVSNLAQDNYLAARNKTLRNNVAWLTLNLAHKYFL